MQSDPLPSNANLLSTSIKQINWNGKLNKQVKTTHMLLVGFIQDRFVYLHCDASADRPVLNVCFITAEVVPEAMHLDCFPLTVADFKCIMACGCNLIKVGF